MTAKNPYDSQFFQRQRSGSARAAATVVPWLIETFKPNRVVDIGCGIGTWSETFIQCGISDVMGIDGEYVDTNLLQIPINKFRHLDLSIAEPANIPENFDISICLEVAEHLPPNRSESFVRFVASLAPIAVFGAAIPGQPGVDHINLRWQSYWAGLFAEHGFMALDILRPHFWSSDIDYWYIQNTIIYVSKGVNLHLGSPAQLSALDVAHPRLVGALCEKIGRRKPRPAWLSRLRKKLKVRLPGTA